MQSPDRVGFGITLKRSTLTEVDIGRGDIPRTKFIERILEERLGITGGGP